MKSFVPILARAELAQDCEWGSILAWLQGSPKNPFPMQMALSLLRTVGARPRFQLGPERLTDRKAWAGSHRSTATPRLERSCRVFFDGLGCIHLRPYSCPMVIET